MTSSLLMKAYQTKGGRILYFCDEAAMLDGLPALRKMLLLSRSQNMSMILAYQSMSQVKTAFDQQETLIPDNCNTHIHLQVGNKDDAADIKTALGKFTLEVWNRSTNSGVSGGTASPGTTHNHGGSESGQLIGRDLMDESELLRLPGNQQIVMQRGFPAPILAEKVFWFETKQFGGKQHKTARRRLPLVWRAVIGVVIWLGVMLTWKAVKDSQYQQVQSWQKK